MITNNAEIYIDKLRDSVDSTHSYNEQVIQAYGVAREYITNQVKLYQAQKEAVKGNLEATAKLEQEENELLESVIASFREIVENHQQPAIEQASPVSPLSAESSIDQLRTALNGVSQPSYHIAEAYNQARAEIYSKLGLYRQRTLAATGDTATLAEIESEKQSFLTQTVAEFKKIVTAETQQSTEQKKSEKPVLTPYQLAEQYLRKQAQFAAERHQQGSTIEHQTLLDAFNQELAATRAHLKQLITNSVVLFNEQQFGQEIVSKLVDQLQQQSAGKQLAADELAAALEQTAQAEKAKYIFKAEVKVKGAEVRTEVPVEKDTTKLKNFYLGFPGNITRQIESDQRGTIVTDTLAIGDSSLQFVFTLEKGGVMGTIETQLAGAKPLGPDKAIGAFGKLIMSCDKESLRLNMMAWKNNDFQKYGDFYVAFMPLLTFTMNDSQPPKKA